MRPLFLFYILGTQKYGGCWNLIIHGELLNLEHKLEDAKISSQNWDLKWVTFVCVQRDSSYMGRVALGRLVISAVGVVLAHC